MSTIKENLCALLNRLAQNVANAEEMQDMYGNDWDPSKFVETVHDITEQLMNEVSDLDDTEHMGRGS